MGAAGLIEIKRRIKSVEGTKKITKAMGLVATSKLRKARKELTLNEKYNNTCLEISREVFSSISDEYESIYFKTKEYGEKLYIVLTSDTGMCAGYNGNIAAYLKKDMNNNDNGEKIIVVGRRGISAIKKYGISPFIEFVDMSDIPTTSEVNKIYNTIISLYEKEEVSEVNIVYTKFITPSTQEVKIEKILPFEKCKANYNSDYVLEPNKDEILSNTVSIYLKNKIKRYMLSSKASEQSARMTAMDSATENANDILQALYKKFNRIRQGMITQEITEIVSGAEAQK